MNTSRTLFILLLIWIGLGSFVCHEYICVEEKVAPVVVKPKVKAEPMWLISDGEAFETSSKNVIRFNDSSVDYQAFTGDVEASVNKAIAYLKSNPNKQVTITGYYANQEVYSGLFPNLGEARANKLKTVFKNAGVPSKQLNTEAKLWDAKTYKGKGLDQGADFSFSEFSGEDSRLKRIESELLKKPLTLYFNTGESEIKFSAEQRANLADMVYYIDKKENTGLTISGHSDNVGARAYNIGLSKERAAQVQEYVTSRLGLSEGQYVVEGSGPDKPIASNDTEEGKAKNRRVEIALTNFSSNNQ